MVGDPKLLAEPIAPQLLYSERESKLVAVYNDRLLLCSCFGCDGLEAGEVWGKQWMKVLALIHEGITNGYDAGKLIGGDTAEGSAARTRVLVSLENIVFGNSRRAWYWGI
jgi:nucleoporin GLE1